MFTSEARRAATNRRDVDTFEALVEEKMAVVACPSTDDGQLGAPSGEAYYTNAPNCGSFAFFGLILGSTAAGGRLNA